MKNLIVNFFITLLLPMILMAQEEIPPYFLVGKSDASMTETSQKIKSSLESKEFTIVGEYSPEGNANLHVIAFTRKDLQQTTIKVKDRGALASILKIGLVKKEGRINVSMLNPMYLFYAYLMDEADTYSTGLKAITTDVISAMSSIGNEFTGFGGGVESDDLKEYHYMMMMPYFTDPVEVKEFESFEKGVSTIRKNLEAKKGNTVKVYEVVFENEKVAIFGIGLLDREKGEAYFLPIIGEDNIAAMPYEIILQGNAATMLPGKYRFALHWPELSMKQFMKISNTPGDVEDFLKLITE